LPACVPEEQISALSLSYGEMLVIMKILRKAGDTVICKKIGRYIETRTQYLFLARAIPEEE
jgi:hypothetical protein